MTRGNASLAWHGCRDLAGVPSEIDAVPRVIRVRLRCPHISGRVVCHAARHPPRRPMRNKHSSNVSVHSRLYSARISGVSPNGWHPKLSAATHLNQSPLPAAPAPDQNFSPGLHSLRNGEETASAKWGSWRFFANATADLPIYRGSQSSTYGRFRIALLTVPRMPLEAFRLVSPAAGADMAVASPRLPIHRLRKAEFLKDLSDLSGQGLSFSAIREVQSPIR